MTDFILVYVTTPEEAEALHMARTLVDEKLAACANILPGSGSVYRWRGNVEEGREAILILKTRKDLFERVATRVRGLHTNSIPCIVALPLVAGDPPFLGWLRESTLEAV